MIGVVTEIIKQPVDMYTCLGSSLDKELLTLVSEVASVIPTAYT
jgi:hypothetical protein